MSARDLPPDILATLWAHLPTEQRASIRASVARGLDALKTPEPISLPDWANKHFYLSAESSQAQKRWESYPYQVGMLHAMGDEHIEEVTIKKSARVGYALALDTPIATPIGWSTMGQIKPGDRVFDETGAPCNVRYTSPIYTDHDCFCITFCDGTQIVADAGHRWLVEADSALEYLRGERGQGRTGRPRKGQNISKTGILDTRELHAICQDPTRRNKLAIRNAGALQLPQAALPIPPYTLGLWLGDGHLVTPRITQHLPDCETADRIRAEGIAVSVRCIDKRHPNNATLFLDVPATGRPVSPWAKVFRALGLLTEKHIPAAYLRASAAQRLELLRGLMDSDGTVGKNGRCEFTNTNPTLAQGVFELVCSLGMKASYRMRPPQRPGCMAQFRVNFKAEPGCNPFHLARKAAMVQPMAKPTINTRRRIVSVQPVDAVPVRCIEVDSPSHLFLAGRAMVPTHNTKMLLAAIAYFAQHKRRNQCIWQPTDADSDEFCKAEVEPMLRDVRVMQQVLPSFMRKSKANTLNMKKFLGSILFMKGGTSSGNYRRMTLQVALLDEFSAFDQKIDKSADPWTLAHKRLEGANYPKLIAGSTPRTKGLDHIERRETAATARLRYHVTCPHCGVDHPLQPGRLDIAAVNAGKPILSGFAWDAEDPEGTIRHVCPHCRGHINQADYLRIWKTGVWTSDCGNYHLYIDGTWTDAHGCKLTHPPRHVAFHVWTAYSPQTTWAVIVREFLDALRAMQAGDAAAMEGFTNETLGETWEEEVEKADSHELQQRAEAYPLRRVPPGGLDLVASVDCQEGWWYVSKWAIGRGEESWLVDRQRIDGNLASLDDWENRLYPYVVSPVHHWYGQPMRPRAVAVDTGGHYTHQAYTFCRAHMAEKFLAIKGDSQAEKPIKGRSSAKDVNHRGRTIKGGVKLWLVGTDTAKDLIFGRLKLTKPGPGYIHFSNQLEVEYFKGFTSEVRRTVRTKKGTAHHWVQVYDRNEPLDTAVYCVFASHFLGHHTYTEPMWDRLEQALLPDLFSPLATTEASAEATAEAAPPAPPTPVEIEANNITSTSAEGQKHTQKAPKQRARFVPPAPPANPFAPADWLGRGFT